MLTDASLTFMTALLDAPGPSGFEAAPARRWRAEAEGFAEEGWADVKGNSLAALRVGGAGAPPGVFLCGVDEIDPMFRHTVAERFLCSEPIGGWDPQVFVGQR